MVSISHISAVPTTKHFLKKDNMGGGEKKKGKQKRKLNQIGYRKDVTKPN